MDFAATPRTTAPIRRLAENTHLGYRVDVNKHLIPGTGAHRLERLEPDHLERLYARMQQGGFLLAPLTTCTGRCEPR